jgi:hypothetical protein
MTPKPNLEGSKHLVAPKPNEKRCETCVKRRTDRCPVIKTTICGFHDKEEQEAFAWDITALVGCNSHEADGITLCHALVRLSLLQEVGDQTLIEDKHCKVCTIASAIETRNLNDPVMKYIVGVGGIYLPDESNFTGVVPVYRVV